MDSLQIQARQLSRLRFQFLTKVSRKSIFRRVSILKKFDPQSQPAGVMFADDSFLVFYEVIRYGYPDDETTSPTIFRPKYSFHYQRPIDHFYFRYDKHPDVGEPQTHPLHHLHSAGWLEGVTKLQSVPRYSVSEIMLEDVLHLILTSFPDVMSA